MGGAVSLRILFSLVALRLLAIIGLTLAGGLLLVWVAWKLYRDLSRPKASDGEAHASAPPRSLRSAALSILAADLSMSLDNALAVAGAAQDHVEVLVAGLVLSVALVAVAAEWIARTIARRPWLGYIGLAVVSYVAADMIVRGSREVLHSL
jgi:YjbE family integral membrane protein